MHNEYGQSLLFLRQARGEIDGMNISSSTEMEWVSPAANLWRDRWQEQLHHHRRIGKFMDEVYRGILQIASAPEIGGG